MLTLTDMDVQPSQLQHKGRSNNVSDAKKKWGTRAQLFLILELIVF